MTAPLVIKVKDKDNVAIAVHDLPVGTEVLPGVVSLQPFPRPTKSP